MTTNDNALSQAIAQANSIAAMVGALNVDYGRLEELRDEVASLEYDFKEAQDAMLPMDAETMETFKAAKEALAAWHEENADEYRELAVGANDNDSEDEAREAIRNDALDVKVRADWSNPGEQASASEFYILLCTGGPAVRIVGELDDYMQPCRAWIEYQDWGTPWTYCDEATALAGDALLEYCQQFYFGE